MIVGREPAAEANDNQQAQPMLTRVLVNTEQVSGTVSLVGGYFSKANFRSLAALGSEASDALQSQASRTGGAGAGVSGVN